MQMNEPAICHRDMTTTTTTTPRRRGREAVFATAPGVFLPRLARNVARIKTIRAPLFPRAKRSPLQIIGEFCAAPGRLPTPPPLPPLLQRRIAVSRRTALKHSRNAINSSRYVALQLGEGRGGEVVSALSSFEARANIMFARKTLGKNRREDEE